MLWANYSSRAHSGPSAADKSANVIHFIQGATLGRNRELLDHCGLFQRTWCKAKRSREIQIGKERQYHNDRNDGGQSNELRQEFRLAVPRTEIGGDGYVDAEGEAQHRIDAHDELVTGIKSQANCAI